MDLECRAGGGLWAIEDISKRKTAEEQLNTLAFYDPLTNLANRRLLLDRLSQALSSVHRSQSTGALLFIDLDNFKIINDTLGHDIGDQLLVQAANRLRNCVRENDTIVRLGGDEFVALLDGLAQDGTKPPTTQELSPRKSSVCSVTPIVAARTIAIAAQVSESLF